VLNPKNPYARRYASLSITDLLDAREAFHVHLMQMENVFATAIGLYRIRKDDLDYKTYHPAGKPRRRTAARRRLPGPWRTPSSSPGRGPACWSFVKSWLKPADYHAGAMSGQIVPPFLDLPDGRVIRPA